MVKHILLKCDEAFFYKLLSHKIKLEKEQGISLNWEQFIDQLFGLAKKFKKEVVRANGKS